MSKVKIISAPFGAGGTHVWVNGNEINRIHDIQVRFPLGGPVSVSLELLPDCLHIEGEMDVSTFAMRTPTAADLEFIDSRPLPKF